MQQTVAIETWNEKQSYPESKHLFLESVQGIKII